MPEVIVPTKQELKWVITNDFSKKEPCCLSVKLDGFEYDAFIKWDGCCEVRRYNNGHQDEYDQIHICDIPQFITILQSLEDFRMNNIVGAE